MSGHAQPPVPIGNGVTGRPESVRDGMRGPKSEFDQLVIDCVKHVTIIPMFQLSVVSR